ncbi:MAG: dihydrodipicolinate synthase family protein [Desulfovibrio sp.]|jgi:4-hydroxy-tetrahydrodipicolinate synthase|nr:dihydrodipicolinate synthase family protein [Desulfovibrio sp.]
MVIQRETAATPRLRGVLAPVLTPFKENLTPDPARFTAHCLRLLACGAGVAVFGTTSEANSLSVGERMDLLDALLDADIAPSLLMAGTGCCALPDTVALTRKAVDSGCSGVLMLSPFYYKNVGDDGLFAAYSEVVQRVGDARLRICLYHIPAVSGVPLSIPLIERLLTAWPGVVAGIKDSSGEWSHTETLLRHFQSETFDVFCGSEVFLLQTLRGGAGCITATANVNAAAVVDLCRTWQEADAEAKQRALADTRKIFEMMPVIASMKSYLARQLHDPAWATVRPPLVQVGKDDAALLQKELVSAGFPIPRLQE